MSVQTMLRAKKVFNVHDYDKMIRAGVFDLDNRYELIEGEIVEKMPQGDLHISVINRLNWIFNRLSNDNFIVSVQNAVRISNLSEPEPDVALLRWRDDFYVGAKANAKDALLIIEVADSSTSKDRRFKIPLYASCGIEEVWLLNLQRGVLEIYCELKNEKYQVVRKVGKDETVSPSLLPEISVKVANLFG